MKWVKRKDNKWYGIIFVKNNKKFVSSGIYKWELIEEKEKQLTLFIPTKNEIIKFKNKFNKYFPYYNFIV